jgi:hypothetical protein
VLFQFKVVRSDDLRELLEEALWRVDWLIAVAELGQLARDDGLLVQRGRGCCWWRRNIAFTSGSTAPRVVECVSEVIKDGTLCPDDAERSRGLFLMLRSESKLVRARAEFLDALVGLDNLCLQRCDILAVMTL